MFARLSASPRLAVLCCALGLLGGCSDRDSAAGGSPGAPRAPVGLTAQGSAGPSRVELNWTDRARHETAFRIERRAAGSGEFQSIGAVAANVTRFEDRSAVPQRSYDYRVLAHNAAGDSPPSNSVQASVPPRRPAPPSGLSAVATDPTRVELSWTDAADADGYRVERGPPGGSFAPRAILAAGVITYADTEVTSNTAYVYRVVASNAGGESGPSDPAAVTTPIGVPAAPEELSATASPSQVELSWRDMATDETDYQVERRPATGGSFTLLASLGMDAETYTDAAVMPAIGYEYRVQANNALGSSPALLLSVLLPAPPEIHTVAGSGGVTGQPGDGGPATSAELTFPSGVCANAAGDLFIVEQGSHRVRRVDAQTGIIATLAGQGLAGSGGDGGPAGAARLAYPRRAILDPDGHLFIVDQGNHRIRRVDAGSGVISTVAGTGVPGYSGDAGRADAAQLWAPADVVRNSDGDLLIADQSNHVVRLVKASGIIVTLVGTGVLGTAGDGGPAHAAQLTFPSALALDAAGNLFIADQTNHLVRRVDGQTAVISTVVGDGSPGASGDGGPAAQARLHTPTGLAFDAAGHLLIADSANQRIRRIDTQSGIISTVAGVGSSGYSGDGGPAAAAELNHPNGVAADAGGNLLITDSGNHRLRRAGP